MSVIHIYGASGSGTSTLGKALQEKINYIQLDTDDYYWETTNPPFTTKRSIEERIYLLKKELSQSTNMIISGSLSGWGDELIPYFDLVIRLVTSTSLRLKRLEEREFKLFGSRIHNGGDMYHHHQDFFNLAREYDEGDVTMRSKAKHDQCEKLIRCEYITLDGSQSIERLLKEIMEQYTDFHVIQR